MSLKIPEKMFAWRKHRGHPEPVRGLNTHYLPACLGEHHAQVLGGGPGN